MNDEFRQGEIDAAAMRFSASWNLLDVLGETNVKDSRGAARKSEITTEYEDIPFEWLENKNGVRLMVGDKPIAYGNYLFKLPVIHNGTRIDLTTANTLKVLEVGLEPEKIFSIVEIFDNAGKEYEVEARKES